MNNIYSKSPKYPIKQMQMALLLKVTMPYVYKLKII